MVVRNQQKDCKLKYLLQLTNLSLVVRKPVFGFFDLSHTNQAVQPQQIARGLKFRIYEVEGSYYPCSENKCADQLRGHREADLRICFRICKKPVFSRRCSLHDAAFLFAFDCKFL